MKQGARILVEPDFRLIQALVGSQQNFVLSDPSLPDNPIVYCSDGFCKITGYVNYGLCLLCLKDYCSILLLSYSIYSAALGNPDLLLSYSIIISLALHNIIILIIPLISLSF